MVRPPAYVLGCSYWVLMFVSDVGRTDAGDGPLCHTSLWLAFAILTHLICFPRVVRGSCILVWFGCVVVCLLVSVLRFLFRGLLGFVFLCSSWIE